MACLGLRSDERNKVYHVMGLMICFMVLAQKGCAYEFKVGGSGDWSEDSKTGSYNTWAESKRFRVGDSLVFDYHGDESVLQVTKQDYTNCNTDSPIASFKNGHTVFTFTQSGPYHFISGDKDHCLKNQKLVVVVMADRSGGSSSSPPPPPPPSSATSLMVGSLGVFIASTLALAL